MFIADHSLKHLPEQAPRKNATYFHILAEGAIALSVTLSGGALFAS